jgi:hypothetical protein
MAFNGYVQVPPDGTGKKISHNVVVVLDYDTGTIPFALDDIIIGQTSGITGKVISVTGSTASGQVHIQLTNTSPLAATTTENLQVSSVTYAKAASTGTTNTTYVPLIRVVDHDNLYHGQRINEKGASSVTFFEGEPTLDAFGNLRTSQCRALAVYEHTQRNYSDLFSIETRSNGTASHNPSQANYLLSVNSTSGSFASRTSNRYHYYLPGTGQLIIMTLGLSDSGRSGNVRRWGYYDDSDGLFFEQSGSSFNAVIRRGGVDTKTSQSHWNTDKLDGNGLSGINLNRAYENFYWIDMAWLGVGEVRFGILKPDGSRIIAHINEHANENLGAYTYNPHLPIKWENYNTTGTSGTSDIRIVCAAVYSDSIASEDYTFWRNSDVETTSSGRIVTTRTPIFSIRNQATNILGSGINHVSIYPETLALYVSGGPVKLEMIHDPQTITSGSWITSSASTIEYDIQGTSINMGSTGFKFITLYFGEGTHNVDLRQYYELNDEALVLRANGNYRVYSYCMTKLTGSTVTVHGTLNYRELS